MWAGDIATEPRTIDAIAALPARGALRQWSCRGGCVEGDRPVSRWLLTPCKSVLRHRRRELVSGSDVLGRGGDGQ